MLRRIARDKILMLLLILIVLIRLFSLSPAGVEHYYTYGVYPVVARTLRLITGWFPFSLGDVIYTLAFLWLFVKLIKLIVLLVRKQFRASVTLEKVLKYIRLLLIVYLAFQLLWGLNYYRLGIADQLGLKVHEYSKEQVVDLTCLLQARLNRFADQEDSLQRQKLDKNATLFATADSVYGLTARKFPFLTYSNPSLKPSLFAAWGDYLGYTGYYNPFTGEAQVKTTVPVFLKPFIICHEMGHQLGYARENEANFISFLACKSSENIDFQYSVYFDLYRYALNDLMRRDIFQAIAIGKNIHPRVRNDMRVLQAYFRRTKNPIEPLSNKFYDQYLKLNNQPNGFQTYNEVVSWLIAYKERYGPERM